MPSPELPPRTSSWTAFALVGFAAGVITVILVVLALR
jgi:hypothetical protein